MSASSQDPWRQGIRRAIAELDRSDDRALLELARSRGLLTADQVRDALREFEEAVRRGETATLRDILFRRRWLSTSQIAALLQEQAQRSLATDRYELLEEVGRGGMAVVYRARDRSLGREVAIKVLRQELVGSRAAVSRMIREARVIAGLNHPNLIRLYDLGEEMPPYLVMEYVRGRTLAESLRDGSGGPKGRLRILEQAAGAVQAAHERGVIHRDLKPDNILVDDAGRAVVMDFGLAHLAASRSELTRPGAVLGTPLYMAPEQARGGTIDARTDVYSLGAILYEMLSGSPPFRADGAAELYDRILHADPAPPGRVRGGVPADLQTICLKALEKDPRDRYATAAGFAEDLRRYLNGDPIEARPPSLWGRIRRRFRRNKALILGASAGLAITSAAGAVLMLQADRNERALATERNLAGRRVEALQSLATHWATVTELKRDFRQLRIPAEEARRELADALKRIDSHLRVWKEDPQGYYVRARGRIYLGDLAGAEEDLRQALARRPDFRPAWSLLGVLKVEKYHESMLAVPDNGLAWRLGQLDALLKEATDAFARGWVPGKAREESEKWGLAWTREDQVMERVAGALRLAGNPERHDEARRCLEEAAQEYKAEEYALWRGVFARSAEDSTRWLDAAVEWAPGYEKGYMSRGEARTAAGDFDGAIADFDRVIRMNPGSAMAFISRGNAKDDKGDPAGAIADFNRALELEKNSPTAYNNRGTSKQARGDLEGALADFDRAIALKKDFVEAYYNRGSARVAKGDPAGAIPDFDRAIEIWKDFADAYFNRGNAKMATRDFEGAVADFTRVLEVNERDPEAHNNRGSSKMSLNDLDGALADFGRAIELRKDYVEAYVNRGKLKSMSGNVAGAQLDWENALRIAPPDWPHRKSLEVMLSGLPRR